MEANASWKAIMVAIRLDNDPRMMKMLRRWCGLVAGHDPRILYASQHHMKDLVAEACRSSTRLQNHRRTAILDEVFLGWYPRDLQILARRLQRYLERMSHSLLPCSVVSSFPGYFTMSERLRLQMKGASQSE